MKLFARLGEEIIFKVYFASKNDISTINNDKINPIKPVTMCSVKILEKYCINIY